MCNDEIKSLRAKGYSYSEISKKVDKSVKFVYYIAKDIKFSKNGKKRYYSNVKGILSQIKPQKSFLTPAKIRIIGHLLFDGTVYKLGYSSIMKYINSSKALINQFTEDVKEVYGINPSAFETLDGVKMACYKVHFSSKKMYDNLIKYFSSYSSKKNIKIPNIIINAGNNLKIEFLRTFWEDEGSISQNGRITADLKNENIIKSLVKLHREFGLNFKLIQYKVYTGKMYKIYLLKNEKNLERFYNLGLFEKSIITHGLNVGKMKKDVLKTQLEKLKKHKNLTRLKRP